MNTPTNPISLRITDEEMALLDSRVGLDGARNRSDVIRAAIRSYLEKQPLLLKWILLQFHWEDVES